MVSSHGRGRVIPDSPPMGVPATFLVIVLATLWPIAAQSDGHLPSETSMDAADGLESTPEAHSADIGADTGVIETNISESGAESASDIGISDEGGTSQEIFQKSDDLDTDIGALEEDLMDLNMELRILEEDILYPASSRIAVYLSMDTGQLFQLDSVTLKLNNKEVSHHLYTERQVAALHQGGVQRLYVGNARQGDNELTAVFIGKGPEGRDFTRATAVDFDHGFEPIFVQLSIMDDRKTQQPAFSAEVVR